MFEWIDYAISKGKSMSGGKRFFADDRGNVVDFYENPEKVARLDREAGPTADQLSWYSDASSDLEQWARDNGYGDEIDEAMRNDDA